MKTLSIAKGTQAVMGQVNIDSQEIALAKVLGTHSKPVYCLLFYNQTPTTSDLLIQNSANVFWLSHSKEFTGWSTLKEKKNFKNNCPRFLIISKYGPEFLLLMTFYLKHY